MADANELERLEGFVAKLLTEYNDLRDDKRRLEDTLREREEQISVLEGELAAARAERNVVGSRVKGLIQQIEDWESSLGGSDEGGSSVSQESRTQRNLFSMEREEDTSAPE